MLSNSRSHQETQRLLWKWCKSSPLVRARGGLLADMKALTTTNGDTLPCSQNGTSTRQVSNTSTADREDYTSMPAMEEILNEVDNAEGKLASENAELRLNSGKIMPGDNSAECSDGVTGTHPNGKRVPPEMHRLVQKTGEFNVISRNVTSRRRKFVSDLFTTVVEMRWRYHIILFLASFVACWLVFAAIYLAIVHVHGDIENRENADWVPCIHNVFDFTSAVLYSFETQTTIGYGSRVIDSVCRFGVFVAMLQIYIGTLINMLVTGLVFTKLSRPKSRRQTLVFSRSAVICRRDGQYQLLFRVGDMRIRSHFVGTSVRALLVRSRLTDEGERIPLCQYPLALETETGNNDSYIFLVWPVTVVHRIDASSPFWQTSADSLQTEQFEIIVILEGTVESTGATTQVLTSYLPSEIRWGERLAPLITFHKRNGRCCIDFSHFHDTTPVTMSQRSAKDWQESHCIESCDDDRIDLQSDYPNSFRAGFSRSLSVPAQLTPSRAFIGRKKANWRTGRTQQTKSCSERPESTSNGSAAEWAALDLLPAGASRSTEILQQQSPGSLSWQPGSPGPMLILHQLGNIQESELREDSDSGMSSPAYTVTTKDNPTSLRGLQQSQLENVFEDEARAFDDASAA